MKQKRQHRYKRGVNKDMENLRKKDKWKSWK
jgi:hypothetical protein